MKTPSVAIVVPCYNQGKYLEEALISVREQNYDQWQCIIVNDGSTDNTAEIAREWVEKDCRFTYIDQDHRGVCSARNSAIARSESDLILPLDADDKIAPDYIKEAVHAFIQDADLKVVYCKAEKFGDVKGVWDLPDFSLNLLSYRNLIFSSAMFRKSDWAAVGGYDAKMIYGYEDWEFWISLLKNGGGVKCLNTLGFFYRTQIISRQNNISVLERKQMFNYISIKHADFFVEQNGSFHELYGNLEKQKEQFHHKLESEKFVIDLFLQTFFNFSIFRTRK